METGRFNRVKTERKDRFCKICMEQKVEDELHFLLRCKGTKAFRKSTVKVKLKENPEYKQMSDVDRVRWLLTKENIKYMGDYVYKLFQLRQDHMYKKN